MSYQSLTQQLINTFNSNNYINLVRNNNYHNCTIHFNNEPNFQVLLYYPGYRSKIVNNNINNYDYRLSLNGQPPCHTNIVRDLYDKSVEHPDLRPILINFLIELANEGDDINLNNYANLNIFNNGYTIQQLKTLIPILVLQEDFNFPRPRKGRTLPFCRYIEAVLAADTRNNYTLNDVLNRTNNHRGGVPIPWPEYTRYYNLINNITRP
ncbi:hypothetical protein KCK34_000912 [Clostridium perfringens]|uniref:hypothetical protein n=1 Tax=Clostridium TaxID=1485 RepID=UPI001D60E243|nr:MULTISPECIES: hypothetical protein [Clostridium]EHK2334484.1 hypothetical protein [Clostridium perfringens]MDK0798451.1 hypothetical protein [Clostridium perfringens]MDM0866189.1 hypothetical protein [Clostridium perfringens]MDU4427913.1 hypothetical protein [Clostridium sp.]MDU7456288.1 hypothetical protein [Clostridium perfringens]